MFFISITCQWFPHVVYREINVIANSLSYQLFSGMVAGCCKHNLMKLLICCMQGECHQDFLYLNTTQLINSNKAFKRSIKAVSTFGLCALPAKGMWYTNVKKSGFSFDWRGGVVWKSLKSCKLLTTQIFGDLLKYYWWDFKLAFLVNNPCLQNE